MPRNPSKPSAPGHAIRLRVVVEVDSDPIRGTVATADASAVAFTGWIELTQLLERAHTHDPHHSYRQPDTEPS